ncbi:MAG: FlgD immunoglobulin-like domain containing protein [Candidatus Helarchaeota archaeon]
MKNLVRLFAYLLFFFTNLNILFADEAAFRLVVTRNDKAVGGEFHVDLQIKITNGTSPRTLNSLTVDVYYSSELAEWPSNPGTSWAFSFLDGYSQSISKLSGYYRIIVTGDNVNAKLKNSYPGDPPGWDVTTSWQSIVTLRWIIITATSVNISINDQTDEAAYFNNLTNAPPGDVTDWTVTNEDLGDISLPVELATFEAKAVNNSIVIRWITDSEVNNLGFELYRSNVKDGKYNLISSYQTNDALKGYGNSNTRNEYFFKDELVVTGEEYWYKLSDVDFNGVKTFHGPVSATVPVKNLIPTALKLYPNYPNPFNSLTKLKIDVPESTSSKQYISVVIYDILGHVIKTLYQGKITAGKHELSWDGKTDSGTVAPGGVYFTVIKSDNFNKTIKMLLVK